MKLPKPGDVRPPKLNFESLVTWIYADAGVGKTTFASRMRNALLIQTQEGAEHIECTPVKINSWAEFLEVCKQIPNSGFKTIIVDLVEDLWEMCRVHMLGGYKKTHESDMGYGKGWKVVESEWRRVMAKVVNLGVGVVFISHEDEWEETNAAGRKLTVKGPALDKKARRILFGMCSLVMRFTISEEKGKEIRQIHLDPSEDYKAKQRMVYGFRLPSPIPLSYKEFERVWHETVDKFEESKKGNQ